MSTLIRLLEATAIFRPVMQGIALRQLLPKIVTLAVVGVLTAIVGAAVVMLGFYAINVELNLQGYSEGQSLRVTGCIALMVLICLILWLRRAITNFKQTALPKPTGVMGVVDSFLEGLQQSQAVAPQAKPHETKRAS